MKKLLLIFTLIFMVTSCDDNMSYMEEMTDLQLIEAIANDPNKFEVDGVDIPQASQFVVAAEYYDYMLISAEISPEHGYLISMGDMALDAGDVTEIFFAKDGRKCTGSNIPESIFPRFTLATPQLNTCFINCFKDVLLLW